MTQGNPLLSKMKEVYSLDKTVIRILENQVKEVESLRILKCMKELLATTKTEALLTKQYLDMSARKLNLD